MQKEIEDNKKIGIKDLLRIMWKVLLYSYRLDKKRSSIIIGVSVVNAVILIVYSWYFSVFLNTAIYNTIGVFLNTKVIVSISIMLGVMLIQSVITFWGLKVSSLFYRKLTTQNYVDLSLASERIDIQTYESSDFTLLKNRVNMYFNKMQSYPDIMQDFISGLIPMIMSTVIIIALNQWVLFGFVMIPAIVNFYVEILDGKTMWEVEKTAGEERKKFSSFYNFFNVKNFIEEIKINGLKDFFIGGIKSSREVMNQLSLKRDAKYFNKKMIAGFVTDFLEIVVPIVLIYQIFTGHLLVGAFFFINGRFTSFTQNFRQVLRTLGRMYKDTPYVSDIFQYLEMQPVLPNGTKTFDRFETLEVKDLGFTYPESDRVILHDFDFTIKRGEKIAVIGLNGAGKTTMTKLLLRFYFPTSGLVQYNGIDIREIDKYNLYQHVGFLPQDFAKFDLTFAESISLGDAGKNIDNDKVIDAAKKANVHEFIMSHKDGYQTQIGKKYKDGVELSGGQWQKMAIASMFYRNAELWILDEPTSAIDAEAEASIFESLAALPDDITVIMISHRFSTVRNADRIMVIDHGGVKESGTHEELLKVKDGEYARLFHLQAEGYK